MKNAIAKSLAQPLFEKRTRLQAELDALQNQIRGLDLAIQLIMDEVEKQQTEAPAPQPVVRERGISETIRALLRDAGSAGLSPQMAVELAAAQGQALNPTSVSSLLSRMKRDGQVAYRKKRYVLTGED